MLAQNKEIFDCANLTQYHNQGYTGKGIKVCVLENDTDHRQTVMMSLLEAAPDCELVCVSFGPDVYNKILVSGANIVTCSHGLIATDYINQAESRKLIEQDIALFCAAGNNGTKGVVKLATDPSWLSVGAVTLAKGKPFIWGYSSAGGELDIAGFIPFIQGAYVYQPVGTSFASPFVAGMMACFYQSFKDKYSRFPSYAEAWNLAVTSTVDLLNPGYDTKTGHGLFVLPNIANIGEYRIEKEAGTLLIGVDAGHGGEDPGAIGPTGLLEKGVTLEISQALGDFIFRDGGADYDVYATRIDDQTKDLVTRTALLNNMKCDLAISIHCNASENREANYISTFIQATGGDAEKLAKAVQANLVQATGWPDGGVRVQNLHMTRVTNMPAILVECGFISNPEQEQQLAQPEFQHRLAQAISAGLRDYLKQLPKEVEAVPAYEEIKIKIGNREVIGLLVNEKTYVPLRDYNEASVEALKSAIDEVVWHNDTRTVEVK